MSKTKTSPTKKRAVSTVRIEGPGLSPHTAYNAVVPSLSDKDGVRFASLASKITLSKAEFQELGRLYKKSGRRTAVTNHNGLTFVQYLKLAPRAGSLW